MQRFDLNWRDAATPWFRLGYHYDDVTFQRINWGEILGISHLKTLTLEISFLLYPHIPDMSFYLSLINSERWWDKGKPPLVMRRGGLASKWERWWTLILHHPLQPRGSDRVFEKYHDPLPTGISVEWCPPTKNFKVPPPKGSMYFHPQVLALRVHFPLTDFVCRVLAYYNVALT